GCPEVDGQLEFCRLLHRDVDRLCAALLDRDGGFGTRRDNGINIEPDELGGDLSKPYTSPLRPAILDRDGAALHPSQFVQSLLKSSSPRRPNDSRSRAQKTEGGQSSSLLCASG